MHVLNLSSGLLNTADWQNSYITIIVMAKHLGFASIAAVQQYLRYAADIGLDIEAALDKAGINPQIVSRNKGRIRGELFQDLIEQLLLQADDPLFGLHSSQQVQTESYDILGEMILNCHTLGESLSLTPEFERLVGDMGVSTLSERYGQTTLAWHPAYAKQHVREQMVDNVLASWFKHAQWLTGKNVSPTKIKLERSAPGKKHIAQYQAFYGCPVEFDADKNAIVFPKELAETPLTMNAGNRLAELTHLAKDTIAELNEPTLRFSIRVSNAIRKQLALGQVNKELLSREFNMTGRTLQRKLNQEGYNYQEMLDSVREELAIDMLKNSSLRPEEIAFNLGFTDVRSFNRRFRTWLNTSPISYRNEYQNDVG